MSYNGPPPKRSNKPDFHPVSPPPPLCKPVDRAPDQKPKDRSGDGWGWGILGFILGASL